MRIHSIYAAVALFPLIVFAGCSGDDDPVATRDAGPDVERDGGEIEERDAGPRDSGVPPDAGLPPDSGVLWYESSCADCDTGCAGGMCLNNGGERFCADACGGDLDGCIDGYNCFDLAQGMGATEYFCVPPGATCEDPATNFGTSCYGDSTGCGPDRTWCEGDFHALGYCTVECSFGPNDCPTGYACGLGDDYVTTVCRATELAPSEQCGRKNDVSEIPCAIDTDCRAGEQCVRSEPEMVGVCAVPCADTTSCGAGEQCAMTHRGTMCLTDDCRCHGDFLPAGTPAGTPNLLNEALQNAGLSRCGLLWDVHDFGNLPKDILADPYRLSWFNRVHNEPLRGPDFAKSVVGDLDDAAESGMPVTTRAARMIEQLAVLVDRPAVTHPPTMADPVEPLAEAIIDLIEDAGGVANRTAIVADAGDVPMALQLALADVVDAVRRAELAQKAAVPNAGSRNSLYLYGAAFVARRADGFGLNAASRNTRTLLNDGVDYGELYGAQVDLLDAIGAADLGRFRGTPTSTLAGSGALLFSQQTPIGRVAIGDAEHGRYVDTASAAGEAWALLVDLGGDDDYRIAAGGNVSPANSVSVLIDLGGTDRYGYEEVGHPLDDTRLPSDAGGRYTPTAPPDMDNGPISLSDVPRQGGGRMGTALLVDLGGDDDHYQSLRMSQGAGFFGTGVLVDDGGNDTYLTEAAAQGSAAFGIGLLFDAGGNDERRSYQFAQGFAFARAAGLLYDVDGDDIYFLDPGDPSVGGDPLYFSAQRAGRANSSLGQGFAFGRRADFSDRAFMSGGLGILVDGAGEDHYDASIFAQGGGFWFGTGILADHSGNDTYDALWYAMATGAHYALGFLLEGGGNDTYGGVLPRINVTIAGAHDFTAAFLIDESGDDVYWGTRITLGAGNVNGIGVFVDNAGNDEYRPRLDYAIGNAALSENTEAGNGRRKVKSIGVFIDAGGTDLYEVADLPPEAPIGNDRVWQQSQNADAAVSFNERGTGIDGTGESTLHAR